MLIFCFVSNQEVFLLTYLKALFYKYIRINILNSVQQKIYMRQVCSTFFSVFFCRKKMWIKYMFNIKASSHII